MTHTSTDAFGRDRVAEPHTIFDSKQLFDNQPLLWDDSEVSGGSTTSTHSTALAASTMGVGATTAGNRVRQTFMRFNYQPGKSQLVMMTSVLDKSGGGTGITRRVGLFDDNNGLFLEDAEGTYQFVRRTKTSGSVVNNAAAQSAWNIDRMDGTGVSHKTIDFSKTQILFIDFEWLGVGSVRMGFVIDGHVFYCHEFLNANVLDVVYMSTPNLPLRYEIDNGGTGAASTMDHICATVISEGGSEKNGVLRYVSTGGTAVAAVVANTVYAVCGVRLKSAYIGATIDLESITLINENSQDFECLVYLNPTVADVFTYGDETNSAVQTATGAAANTITGGTVMSGGMVKASNQGAGSTARDLDNALRLGSSIAGTVDEIVLAARPLAASTASFEGSIAWREIL